MIKRRCILSFSVLFLLLYLFLLGCYHGKKVHLSFDDVSISMKELTTDSMAYTSFFEQSFFKKLKLLHQCCGAKFTLYVYEKDGTYCIDDFPIKYEKELRGNRDWLRFGYHAQTPVDSMAQNVAFSTAYNKVDSNLLAKFGGVLRS